MQTAKTLTPWHIIENQIARLKVFESRIEDLRTLLAEDWYARQSGGTEAIAATARVPFEHPGNPTFSAC